MKETIKTSKGAGLALFAVMYILAYSIGFHVGAAAGGFIWRMLISDICATVVIWVFSLLIRNSSLYDPYWSLTPMVMMVCAAVQYAGTLNIFHYILIGAMMLWSVRLTLNWAFVFENIGWEDWRYRKYRELPAPLWHTANFFGIMMMPTLFVFAGMVPVFVLMSLPASASSLVGSAVVLCGGALEFFADTTMHRYLRQTTGRKTCRDGLWRYSRHPNYFGEIIVWLGAALALVCTDSSLWYLCAGVPAMVVLFLAVSVPLAENRQLARRPDYADYRRQTSKLLLLPPGRAERA